MFSPLQKQSQVALGGASMRSELFGPEELHTSEDQVSGDGGRGGEVEGRGKGEMEGGGKVEGGDGGR